MNRLSSTLACFALLAFLLGAPARAGETPPAEGLGVLVMAHGGKPEWNQAVLDAVEPLGDQYPVEVAFGMADACSLREGVAKLEERGVGRIAVVRLFVSGESWYERTEQILGLREGAPTPAAPGTAPAECAEDAHAGHTVHAGLEQHRMAFFRLASRSRFALSREGLLDAPEMGAILAERARSLSRDPANEDVLVLAHGPADDGENERWLALLDARSEAVRAALPFHRVEVATLREDWPEKRRAAEERIRAFVSSATTQGRRAIVLPFRLFGFGPFAKVLDGESYVADERGLLPHVEVTRWIARQAEDLRATLLAAPVAREGRTSIR